MNFRTLGRGILATVASATLGLGLTSCGVGTIGYMWVTGTQYNQISGFKIDDYTGNLTPVPGSPFTSGGSCPVNIQVKAGGRYVYVVNSGQLCDGNTGSPTIGNIEVFAVGGEGALTPQQSFSPQGNIPVWAQIDPGGNFLYVLTQQAPIVAGDPVAAGSGAITVFSLASDTGRATLVTNQQLKNSITGTYLAYFPVGPNPIMMKLSGGCMYTLDTGGTQQTVFPYVASASNGTLTQATSGAYFIPGATVAANVSSINAFGSSVYLTDVANNLIYPLTQGTGCGLTLSNNGSAVLNLTSTANPSMTLVDSQNKFLYVTNLSSTNSPITVPNSTISAYSLNNGNGNSIQQLPSALDLLNPYGIGSGPTCIVEDPSNKYIYTSNEFDNTVTGKVINPNTGQLSPLQHGSSFPAVGHPTCLAVSGNVQ